MFLDTVQIKVYKDNMINKKMSVIQTDLISIIEQWTVVIDQGEILRMLT